MNIAVIGCGNMASAVVENLYLNNKNVNFYTYTPSKTRAIDLATKVDGKALDSLELFKDVDIDFWLLGFKPQQLKDFSLEFSQNFKDQTIISMLAATSVSSLSHSLRSKNIIRIMPNTPIRVNSGITLFYSDTDTDKNIEKAAQKLFSNSGLIKAKDEKQLDLLTTFSGCGPAYIYLFADTLFQKMQGLGFDNELATKLIKDLFMGSSSLMMAQNLSFNELLDQVTSKAGVTIEAINEYRSSSLNEITSRAIDKAIARTEQINQEINK